MGYREKLQDPRWQKKRLGILERDGFKCALCGDTETTLHVHHKHYNGCDPWNIHEDALVTLCVTCHEYESEALLEVMSDLQMVLRRNFNADELHEITGMLIHNCDPSNYGTHDLPSDARDWFKEPE